MGKRFFVAAAVLLILSAAVHAELKDYIFIIKPVYHQKTRSLFLDLAKYFGDKGNAGAQGYFTGMAGEYAHGTGWVVVDADGQNYLVTNRHVVIGAEKVNAYLESVEGDQKVFSDCPILYVDTQMDLAVIQFPGAQKLFKGGFRLDSRPAKDLTEVVAAGFPGFGGKPLWQVSIGNITNSQARIDPSYSYLIQHSAPIDPGNSGGPLLVKDPAAPIGYSVVGVNTLKALKRESTNFAIPTRHISEVLEKARRAKKLAANPAGLRGELLKSAAILTGELNSDNPVDQDVNKYISDAIVGEKGWQAYQAVLDSAKDQKKFTEWFLEDPVEAMRTSIYWFFAAEADHQAGSVVEFKGINPADETAIGSRGGIRTTFVIGGKQKEIAWSMEYGQWKISDMTLSLPAAPAAVTAPAAAPAAAAANPRPAGPTIYGMHSLLFGMGIPGPYLGIAYTGMIFSSRVVGLSAAMGYTFDGSVFIVGGPAIMAMRGLAIPLRVGVSFTPLGPTFVINPGVLFKFPGLAIGLDFGYAFPGQVIIGAGFGFDWPSAPESGDD
jgi:S1-C subfamily serine protease